MGLFLKSPKCHKLMFKVMLLNRPPCKTFSFNENGRLDCFRNLPNLKIYFFTEVPDLQQSGLEDIKLLSRSTQLSMKF